MSPNPFYVRTLIYTPVSQSDHLCSNALLTGSCWTEAETLYNSQQCLLKLAFNFHLEHEIVPVF